MSDVFGCNYDYGCGDGSGNGGENGFGVGYCLVETEIGVGYGCGNVLNSIDYADQCGDGAGINSGRGQIECNGVGYPCYKGI